MTATSMPPQHAQRRARLGVAALMVRATAQLVLTFAATLILARLLTPADFGVFAIVQFAAALLGLFGNAGFGPALIQQPLAPTQRELATVWWTQLTLAAVVVITLLVGATFIRDVWRDLPAIAESLLRGLAIAFVCNTLRVIPTVQLERELRFAPLAAVELAASLTYFATAVGMAYVTRSVTALVYAVVAQSLVALVSVYAIRPWRPSFEFDRVRLRQILRYGIAYQGNLLVGFANNAIAPLMIGIVLGKIALGLNGFAQTLAWMPLRLVEIFGRVGFPLYSRLREDPARLGGELRFNVQICGIATALFCCLLLVLGEPLLALVYGPKWQAATPLLLIYAAVMLLGFLSPIANAAFYGLGCPGLVFRLAFGWTVLNWLTVGVALFIRPTLEVYALAYSVHVVVGNLVVVAMLQRMVPQARVVRSVAAPALAAVAIAMLGRWLLTPHLTEAWTLALAGLGCCAALGTTVLWGDRSLLPAVRTMLSMIRMHQP